MIRAPLLVLVLVVEDDDDDDDEEESRIYIISIAAPKMVYAAERARLPVNK